MTPPAAARAAGLEAVPAALLSALPGLQELLLAHNNLAALPAGRPAGWLRLRTLDVSRSVLGPRLVRARRRSGAEQLALGLPARAAQPPSTPHRLRAVVRYGRSKTQALTHPRPPAPPACRSNRLRALPGWLGELPSLTFLDAGHNLLERGGLPALGGGAR